jgi:hypothetical protein
MVVEKPALGLRDVVQRAARKGIDLRAASRAQYTGRQQYS